MKHQPTYLYQVKNSKNFYFRIRKNVLSEKIDYHDNISGHFVASLKTSEYDEALWLSQFIYKKIRKEIIMEDYNVVRQQLLNSQIKHLSYINSLFDFSESEFKLRFDAFLKDRFNHWLKLGKSMLAMGVAHTQMLNNFRTLPPSVFNQYYAQGEDVETHPSPDATLVKAFNDEAKRGGMSFEPRLVEAQMLNRLMAELSKAGKKHSQFSFDTVDDIAETDATCDHEFLNLMQTLSEFRNFGRRAERKLEVTKNQHLRLQTCICNFKKSKFKEIGTSGKQCIFWPIGIAFSGS